MTTISIELKLTDELAEEIRKQGVLTPASLVRMLKTELAKKANKDKITGNATSSDQQELPPELLDGIVVIGDLDEALASAWEDWR